MSRLSLNFEVSERAECLQGVSNAFQEGARVGLNEVVDKFNDKEKKPDAEREGKSILDGLVNKLAVQQLTAAAGGADEYAAMKDTDKRPALMKAAMYIRGQIEAGAVEATSFLKENCDPTLLHTIAAEGRKIMGWKGETKTVTNISIGDRILPPPMYMVLGFISFYLAMGKKMRAKYIQQLHQPCDGEEGPTMVESQMEQLHEELGVPYTGDDVRARWNNADIYKKHRTALQLDAISEVQDLIETLNTIWINERLNEAEEATVKAKKVKAKPVAEATEKAAGGDGAGKEAKKRTMICPVCLEHAIRMGMGPAPEKGTKMLQPESHKCNGESINLGFVASVARKAAQNL